MNFLYICLIIAFLILPATAFASSSNKTISSITIDTVLSDTSIENHYQTPMGVISNSSFGVGSKICPSNDCKMVIEEPIGITLELQLPDTMLISNHFRLQDNASNGHFDSKKKALVENVDIFSLCSINDAKEDPVTKTTKYHCGAENSILFTREFNHTAYNYKPAVITFELPSKHLVIQALEKCR